MAFDQTTVLRQPTETTADRLNELLFAELMQEFLERHKRFLPIKQVITLLATILEIIDNPNKITGFYNLIAIDAKPTSVEKSVYAYYRNYPQRVTKDRVGISHPTIKKYLNEYELMSEPDLQPLFTEPADRLFIESAIQRLLIVLGDGYEVFNVNFR